MPHQVLTMLSKRITIWRNYRFKTHSPLIWNTLEHHVFRNDRLTDTDKVIVESLCGKISKNKYIRMHTQNFTELLQHELKYFFLSFAFLTFNIIHF